MESATLVTHAAAGIETQRIACYGWRYTALQLLHFVGSIPQRLPPNIGFRDLVGVQQQVEQRDDGVGWTMGVLGQLAGSFPCRPDRVQAREDLLRELLFIGCDPLA